MTRQVAAASDSAKEDLRTSSTSPRRNSNSIRTNSTTQTKTWQRQAEIRRERFSFFFRNTRPVARRRRPFIRSHYGRRTRIISRTISLRRFAPGSRFSEKRTLLAQARQAALDDIPTLTRAHDTFDQRVQAQEEQKQAVKQKASGLSQRRGARRRRLEETSGQRYAGCAAPLIAGPESSLRSRQAHPGPDGLAETYANWGILVAARQRVAVHGILKSVLFILLIVLSVYMAGRLIDRYFVELNHRRQATACHTARRRVVCRASRGFAAIAFVVFGMPSQTPTVLGLAGAGLTVALKDFIVGFVGWFVLMGRNGIRVGDWVEINGVGGEVVEISLLRTTLLETGNWTDSGHPTGRKVTFVNSFAIEGHYFNFSTSGQWLWDELTVSVPAAKILIR